MLKNLHRHYAAWRHDALETQVASLRLKAAALPPGMAQDRTYECLNATVAMLNALRRELGRVPVSAYG